MCIKKKTQLRWGGTAVELAVVLPVLTTLILGCIDYGRFAHARSVVINSAREAAAVGAAHPYTDDTLPDWEKMVRDAAIAELKNVDGFDESKLKFSVVRKVDSANLFHVSIALEYPFHTLISWPGLPSQTKLSSRVQFRTTRP